MNRVIRLLAPLAAVASLLATTGCKKLGQQEAAAAELTIPKDETWLTPEQAKRVEVDPVAEHEVGGVIVAAGRVTFDDLHVSHVFSPVSGRVTKIEAQLGQRVKKGQTLAVIESPDIGQASSDLGKADADMIAAQHDYERKKDLFEAHAGSKSDLDIAEDNYRKAKAEEDRAKQKAWLLRAGTVDRVSSTFTLKSLIEGEVITRNVSPGMEISGQYGGGSAVELFTIGELDPVWVIADIFEMDLPRVHPGEKVQVKAVSYPDKAFEGTVDWVSGTLDSGTRTAKVRCIIPNKDKLLKPEMYVTSSISVEGKKTLAVKRSAVLHMGDQTVVYVQDGIAPDGRIKFERRPVSVDEDEDGDYVPVKNGMKPGDKVVTANSILLTGS